MRSNPAYKMTKFLKLDFNPQSEASQYILQTSQASFKPM